MSQILVTGEAKIRDIQGPVVANSGVITALDGAASQYVRGDGTLADFPTSSGGGSSVSYYLNSSVSQGTIGGVAYRELSKDPIIGAGTDIAISSNGYVANYITDVNDPDVTIVAGGNFNCEFYFSVNNNSGNPTTYAELYKYDGTTFTLLGSNVGVPESINQGTTIAPYYFAIPVATTALSVTDRLAIRIYVNVSGRTVTLHTENGHLCQVVTTLSKGMVSLNNLTDQSQYLATGTSGTNFTIASTGDTHTFNLPVASATNTGKLSSTDWSTFNGKVPYTGATANVDLGTNSLFAYDLFANGNGTNNANLYLKQGIASLLIQNGYSNILATGTKIGFQVATSAIAAYYADLQFSSLTAQRTFTLPDITGTLALLEGTQTFSGSKTFSAATKLDLGLFLKESTGSGRLAGYVGISTTATGGMQQLQFLYPVSGSSVFSLPTVGSYNYEFPTASGTIALTSDLGAYVTLATTQTISGAKTFSLDILVNNVKIGNANGSNLNTVVGFGALTGTGVENTAVGYLTLSNNTTGNSNTAVGKRALIHNTTASLNTAIGAESLFTNTTGTTNTAIGYYALFANTTGSNNIAIGNNAGNAITTGSNNTIIGAYVGTTTLANNIVLADGQGNIRYQWNGTNNVFGNPISGTSATFSSSVTAASSITSTSGDIYATDGTRTNYLGVSTGSNIGIIGMTSNHNLTFITNNTERMRITSGGNVGIGTSSPTTALEVSSADLNNIFVTNPTTTGATTGSGLGFKAYNGTSVTQSAGIILTSNTWSFGTYSANQLSIGSDGTGGVALRSANSAPITFHTGASTAGNSTERMRITSGGELQVAYSGGAGLIRSQATYTNTSANVANMYVGSAYEFGRGTASSMRYKENITDWNESGLDTILALQPKTFTYKEEYYKHPERVILGLIAEEVAETCKYLADYENEDGSGQVENVRYAYIVVPLIKAIQEQQAQIEELKALINK